MDFSQAAHHAFSDGSEHPRETNTAMNYQKWIRHFEKNSQNRPEPEWDAPLDLEGNALKKLRRSIQQFQLGDGGGPAQLIAWNRDQYLCDPGTRRVIDLWFNEEKEHSRLLGGLLARLGGERIESHWSFSLFCNLRKFLGVQFELHALLGTEIVSHVYYKMLRKHGPDPALRGVCNLIIRDETGHIAFHRSRLAAEDAEKSDVCGPFRALVFRLRALAAGTVLWVNHRGAVREFGGTDFEFYRWIWRDVSAFINGLRRDTRLAISTRRLNQRIAGSARRFRAPGAARIPGEEAAAKTIAIGTK